MWTTRAGNRARLGVRHVAKIAIGVGIAIAVIAVIVIATADKGPGQIRIF